MEDLALAQLSLWVLRREGCDFMVRVVGVAMAVRCRGGVQFGETDQIEGADVVIVI